MTARLQAVCRQLLWGCMACAPWWGLAQAQAHTLEALIQDTLATHPATTTHRTLTAEERAAIGLDDTWVRLSVGLEDPEDIAEDVEQALAGR